jgi:hypothetical protein
MEKLLILTAIIAIGIVGWYLWTGREGVRTYYQGYVQIEPVSFDVVIERLKKVGCTEQGLTCHYVLDSVSNTLRVNLYEKDTEPFEPGGGFEISDNKAYGDFDIPGRRNSKKFEAALRAQIRRAGNVVNPIEGTGVVTNASDATGVVY